jgi:hypothetical protein
LSNARRARRIAVLIDVLRMLTQRRQCLTREPRQLLIRELAPGFEERDRFGMIMSLGQDIRPVEVLLGLALSIEALLVLLVEFSRHLMASRLCDALQPLVRVAVVGDHSLGSPANVGVL